jgi:hypothetical protein
VRTAILKTPVPNGGRQGPRRARLVLSVSKRLNPVKLHGVVEVGRGVAWLPLKVMRRLGLIVVRVKNMIYRPSKWFFVLWYAILLAISALFLFAFPAGSRGLNPTGVLVVTCLFSPFWLLPLQLLKARVTVTEHGIAQHIPWGGRSRWHLAWDEIQDWSFLEIQDIDGAWNPRVFILADGRIHEFHESIVHAHEATGIAASLKEHCGQPKSANVPVCPTFLGIKKTWRHPKNDSKQ